MLRYCSVLVELGLSSPLVGMNFKVMQFNMEFNQRIIYLYLHNNVLSIQLIS